MGGPVEYAKIFSGSKSVQSPTLNTLGLPVARAVLARTIYRLRSVPTPQDMSAAAATLRSDGMLMLEDFLPPELFAQCQEECVLLVATTAPTKVHQHGPTQVQQFSLHDLDSAAFPGLARWPSNRRAIELAEAAEKRRILPSEGFRVLERVVHGDQALPDPETELHTDIFFNTHKMWLYLDDVQAENAPLVYVPRSHHLSPVRLRREYDDARKGGKGSRRIDDDELRSLGLERKVLACRANTLVVANTCGMHARSTGTPGYTRHALHMSFRFNPFLPRRLHADTTLTTRNPRVARVVELLSAKS